MSRANSHRARHSPAVGNDQMARQIAGIQLEKAGVRLAAILNHALGS
jgi:hypothetical protein